MMGVDFAREGMLGVIGGEEVKGGVGGISRLLLKERKNPLR